jgi:uncharacterized protein YegP (UPF0339 family)
MGTVIRSVLVAVVLTAAIGVVGSPVVSGQQKKGADKGADAKAATAVFEVYTDKGGKFRFRITSGDETLAIAGHGYATKDECMKTVDAIRRMAAKAKVEDSAGAATKGK